MKTQSIRQRLSAKEQSDSITNHLNPAPTRKHRLLDFHELPLWLQDNVFIEKYYRPQMSFTDCFYSIFELHNETGNIWTHLQNETLRALETLGTA